MVDKNKIKVGIKAKLVLMISCLLIGSSAVSGIVSYLNMEASYREQILEIQNGFDTKIQTAVENLIGVLNVNEQRCQAGELTEQEAMEMAKKIVRDTRYDQGNGYFWADLADGTCAIHMNIENEGVMRYDFQDPYGTYYIRNILEAGNQKNGGFTEFYYNKPGESENVKKRAYTLLFDPYGWYISTGNYYDDIETSIGTIQKEKQSQELLILFAAIFVSLIGVAMAYLAAKKFVDPVIAVTKRLTLLSEGDVKTEPCEVSATRDEIGLLTRAAESVILQIRFIIGDISEQLQKIAGGDMTLVQTYEYIGDYIPIMESIRNIRTSLNGTLRAIETSAGQVSGSAAQISSMAQNLAAGATEQSSTIEAVSNSVGSVSAGAQENAQNASTVSGDMEDTMSSIQNADHAMKNMLVSMSQISHAAEEISHITALIESIAFQTNILALNASIEAARAGTAGKGFAVVADEVRVLAEKSSEAAHQTDKLIQASQQAVSDGSGIAQDMSVMVEESVQKIHKAKTAIELIGVKSENQAQAIREISDSISRITTVVQSNAATAQESSASSEELSAQASVLYAELEKFTLSKEKSLV